MRYLITLIAFAAIAAMMAVPATADYDNTLYGQEGTGADGYPAIDASGQGPAKDDSDNYTNWKYQYGSGSWSGVYSWDGHAWLTEAADGDSKIEIEADIEMYWAETIENNKIYFHLGNPFTADAAAKRAYVNGTYATNNLMYVGISFDGTSKTDGDFETDGGGLTGRVLNGMVGSVDIGGRDIRSEAFDVKFSLSVNGGAWTTPSNFGSGAHGTIIDTLWWHPVEVGMTLGTGTMLWKVEIEPDTAQPDGNYHLDPAIVAAPVL